MCSDGKWSNLFIAKRTKTKQNYDDDNEKDENDPPSLIAPVKDIESCADIAQI